MTLSCPAVLIERPFPTSAQVSGIQTSSMTEGTRRPDLLPFDPFPISDLLRKPHSSQSQPQGLDLLFWALGGNELRSPHSFFRFDFLPYQGGKTWGEDNRV